jgi:chitodextrinase
MSAAPSVSADASCASAGGCVVVHQYVGGQDTVVKQLSSADIQSSSDVSPDGGSTDYGVRFKGQKNGDQSTDHVSQGLSINQVLVNSGFDPTKVTFTAVPRLDGTWATLSTPQLQKPVADGVFVDSLLPVVHSIGDGMEYVRPLTGPNDANNNDVFTPADASTPLDVYVFTGPELTVKETASKRKVQPGTPVQFSATVTDNGTARPASSVDYSWTFGPDGTASTASPTHTFAKAGTYLVLLTVTGATDGAGGQATPVLITVGSPKAGPTKTSSPGPTPTKTPDPTQTPKPPTSTPPPPTSSPQPTPHPGSGHSTGVPKLPRTLFPRGSLAGRLSRNFTRLQQQSLGGQPTLAPPPNQPVVSGQVVGGGSVPLTASALASDATSVESTPAVDDATRWSPGVVPGYVGVVLLLLGVGIARERGWLTLRRR